MVKYAVWTYDVWGNAEDGYDVNDRHKIAVVDLSEKPTDGEIIQAMYDTGIVTNEGIRNQMEVTGEPELLYVNVEEDGYPVAELVKE